MQSEEELEKHFSGALACKIIVSLSKNQIDESVLNSVEKTALSKMNHALRRASWLRGRNAIYSLLKRIGNVNDIDLPADTANLSMPHAHLSLSHSGEYAVAVARLEGKGIGVDIESPRLIRTGATRFFLASEAEKEWQDSINQTTLNDELLRLWTTKESLFKADLSNKGKVLNCYTVIQPHLHSGDAALAEAPSDAKFKYCSIKFAEYWLTVSIAKNA